MYYVLSILRCAFFHAIYILCIHVCVLYCRLRDEIGRENSPVDVAGEPDR